MTIIARTDAGTIRWEDGHLSAPAAALARLHNADPEAVYGCIPGVSLAEAYDFADPFLDLLQRVFPDAEIQHDPLEEDDENLIH